MAKIVCIAEGTYRQGINNLGDIVSIHDDDVELGPSYDGFEIIQINALDGPATRAGLELLLPHQKPEKTNKYRHRIINKTSEKLNTLKSGALTKEQLMIYIDNIVEND